MMIPLHALNKTDHVNMMKQLYLRGDGHGNAPQQQHHHYSASTTIEPKVSSDLKLPSLTSGNISYHNNATGGISYTNDSINNISTTTSIITHPPIKEVVKDIDLTDSDLSLVSKYFQSDTSVIIPYHYSRDDSITTPMMAMMMMDSDSDSSINNTTTNNNSIINNNTINNNRTIINNKIINNSISSQYNNMKSYDGAHAFNIDDADDLDYDYDYKHGSKQHINNYNRGIAALQHEATIDTYSLEGLLNWSNELELDIS